MRRISAIAVISFLISLFSFLPAHASAPGDLIKIACPAGSGASHPCRAVYYFGADAKRHAFPNDKAYFTWYADFNGVKTLTDAAMAAIPLGGNVTYRPGIKMVKFPSIDKVYAIDLGGQLRWIQTEDAAKTLYGNEWNKNVDDVNEAFFTDYRSGADIVTASAFSPTAARDAAPSIDADKGMVYVRKNVITSRGTFDVSVIILRKNRAAMTTLVAEPSDCDNGCAARPLADYASSNAAGIGLHGTYFCPPDYANCAGQTYSFLWPVYDAATGQMRNASSLPVHEGPIIAYATDGRYFFFHRTRDFGSSVAGFESVNHATLAGAMANYPSLVEGGNVIVESESRLDDGMKTIKGTRGGIGYGDESVYLVVARSATVVDLAYVMQTLGATYAMNLDGGGSAAMLYGGAYKVGPGRLLPNAIVFKMK
ncbi:MAG TPA: phosphodiester glycosidase family protein [Candidatus Eisenbacteria bacterium]|nr:phosphodiester glycosidase family protein [Candidatus Eisenbacteria bacterium]